MSDKRWWTIQKMNWLMDLNSPQVRSQSRSQSRRRWRCSPLERAPSATTPPPRSLSVMPAAALPLADWSVSLPRPSQMPAPVESNSMYWKWVNQKATTAYDYHDFIVILITYDFHYKDINFFLYLCLRIGFLQWIYWRAKLFISVWTF